MRKTSHWRLAARQRIRDVGTRLIAENPEAKLEWIRAEISKTYPFGSRENRPYQVWLEELNDYIESLKPETPWYEGRVAKPPKTWHRREIKPIPIAEGQLNLFDLDSPET
jgi:hypothetical protein